MNHTFYAFYQSEKEIEHVTGQLSQIDESIKYEVLRKGHAENRVVVPQANQVDSVSPSVVSPSGGLFPVPSVVDGAPLYFDRLPAADRELLNQRLGGGAPVLGITLANNDKLDKVLSLLREASSYVVDNSGIFTPVASNDPAIILNNLLALCLDGAEGYKIAANRIDDDVYKRFFNDYAIQRERFAAQLSDLVRSMGVNPAESSTWLGSLHQNWIKLRAALTSEEDPHAILAEAHRGEEVVKDAFEHAFHGELPEDAREIVRTQLSEVYVAFKRLKSLVSVTEAK